MTDHLVVQPNKDLDAVCTRLPLVRRSFPFGEAIAAHLTVPWNGFKVDEFALAEPERSPLCAGRHLIVAKDGTHVANGILEDRGSLELGQIRAVPCELERTENCIWVGCHFALE